MRGWCRCSKIVFFSSFSFPFSELFDRINAVLNQVGNEPIKMWLGPFLMIALKNPEHLEVSENEKINILTFIYLLLIFIQLQRPHISTTACTSDSK